MEQAIVPQRTAPEPVLKATVAFNRIVEQSDRQLDPNLQALTQGLGGNYCVGANSTRSKFVAR